jgi:hypothetical protein
MISFMARTNATRRTANRERPWRRRPDHRVSCLARRLTTVTGSRWRRAVPTVAALVVLACSAPLAWTGTTPITNACDDVVAAPDERGASDSETSLWPPGVRCTSRFSDGRALEGTYVTWYELMLAPFLAAWTWVIFAAVLRVVPMRQLLTCATAAAATFVAATVAFFL